MLYSQLFSRTSKDIPSDETSKNAQLLIRAGYIHKEMAGVYSFLPLGYKVLQNIIHIIREEMDKIGGNEMLMSSLQDPSIWKKSNRWTDNKDVDAWFTTKLKNDTELGLGFTHEEDITNIASKFVKSYKNLPLLAYQFQNKFRNETRAKSGIMRTREFIMKDLYSFARDEEEHEILYNRVADAYKIIFKRLGIGDKTYKTFASGGVFSKYSHEYQTLCEAGEDEIYVCDRLGMAINKEVYNDEVLADLGVGKDELRVAPASEVGNIFSLGTRFSSALDLKYKNEKGEEKEVVMGSYGIGPARVMGIIAELISDDRGLIWPTEIAPYALYLVSLHKEKGDEVYNYSEEIYNVLRGSGVDVMWDDRESAAGEKLADADLIGIPVRVLVSTKTIEQGGVEIKERVASQTEIVTKEQFLKSWTEACN
ncbi:MAG: prolyl-tRNA synthetase [Patescibacteria group bacterium]|nr:prolyl-tRNA synthetase [Patescibacteria group bacterium]